MFYYPFIFEINSSRRHYVDDDTCQFFEKQFFIFMRFYDENNNIVIISNHCTAIKIYELSKTLLDFHCLTFEK